VVEIGVGHDEALRDKNRRGSIEAPDACRYLNATIPPDTDDLLR
jgi:hypothetical protein